MSSKHKFLYATLFSTIAMVAVLYQSIQFKKNILERKRVFSLVTQSWTRHASSMVLEHHRLLESMSLYVSSDERSKTTIEDVVERLDIYWSKYDGLSMYKNPRFSAIANEPKISGETGFQIDTVLTHVESLVAEGKPTLESIEARFNNFTPGNYELYFELVNELSLLSKHVSALQFNTYNVLRDLQNMHVALSEGLNRKLSTAYGLLGIGIIILLVLQIMYWRNKHKSAESLRLSNERLVEKINESESLAEKLEHQATHDNLTGVLNRAGFDALLETVVKKETGQFGVCMLDIDRFKVVNDTAGHAAGDILLKQLAISLQKMLPSNVRLARYGGDEFILVWPDCKRTDFESCIKSCCAAIDPYNFKYRDFEFEVAGSFGALHFNAGEHASKTVFEYVDAACYKAKRSGGARVHFGGDSLRLIQSRQSDIEWLSRIQAAFSQDQFLLYYQPIVEAGNINNVYSWELLIRMVSDSGEVTIPAQFLSVAEQYGLSSKIDHWVVNTAFTWISENPGICENIACININLSGQSISDETFLQTILKLQQQHQIDARKICFEITETAVVGEMAREFMNRLRESGFRLALDDFGSGFASFGYLEKLPVDYIKIDGLFVKSIDTNETYQAFVKAINAIGHAMHKSTIADFVENEESMFILNEIGIDYLQGYQTGEPKALPDCALWQYPGVHAA